MEIASEEPVVTVPMLVPAQHRGRACSSAAGSMASS